MRQCFANLALYAKIRVKKRAAEALVVTRCRQRLMKLVFNCLADKSQQKQRLTTIQSGLEAAFNKIKQRKVFVAL